MRRRALLVLGMHRSGTSLLAGLLVRLGVDGPRTLMPPDESNPLGYWESDRIVEFHERLLRAAGTSWDAWTPVDASRPTLAPFAAELPGLVAAEFGTGPVFVVKDPRMCRLVPFWIHALDGAGIAAAPILVVREPADVSRSLAARDGLPPQLSRLMWLRHMLDAESATRGLPRSIVSYREMLSGWRAVVDRIADELAVRWPIAPETAGDAVQSFVKADLRHHDASPDDLDACPPLDRWVAEAHEAFERLRHQDAAARAQAHATLDAIRRELDAASAQFGLGDEAARDRVARRLELAEAETRTLRAHAAAVQVAADAARARATALQREVSALEAGLESERHHVQALLSSGSWRLTAPLRAAFDLLRRIAGRTSRGPGA